MRSVRLDPDLEARLARAAAVRGETVSQFIRKAAAERADATLGASPDDLEDIFGAIRGGGGQARRTGEAFRDVLSRRPSVDPH